MFCFIFRQLIKVLGHYGEGGLYPEGLWSTCIFNLTNNSPYDRESSSGCVRSSLKYLRLVALQLRKASSSKSLLNCLHSFAYIHLPTFICLYSIAYVQLTVNDRCSGHWQAILLDCSFQLDFLIKLFFVRWDCWWWWSLSSVCQWRSFLVILL